jgi:uncharacterized SAM-dependent methyltransferase
MLVCRKRQRSYAPLHPSSRDEVLQGLEARPRAIPPSWFYDHPGCELFEAITELPEYDPSRTELLPMAEAAKQAVGSPASLNVITDGGWLLQRRAVGNLRNTVPRSAVKWN